MGAMKKVGDSVAKRPMVPILILLLITGASIGIIANSPPSFDMDEESFRPDNEMVNASLIISEAFNSTTSVMSMADMGAGGNIFTKDIFMDILSYEEDLQNMKYVDKDGIEGNDYSAIPMFTVVSPVSVIAAWILENASPAERALFISQYMTDFGIVNPLDLTDHDHLRAAIYGLADDDALKEAFHNGLTDPLTGILLDGQKAAILISMTTSDLDPISLAADPFDPNAVVARGCMVTVMMLDSGLNGIKDGQLGFERDVIAVADEFEITHSKGLTIKVAGMITMMSEIGKLAQDDISMLLPIALVVIVLLLILIYRDIADTLIGLLGLIVAIIWTFGISTLIGIQMSTIAIAVPILILALGIDYSLHLVFRYREERRCGQDIKGSIAKTMGSVGEALTLATVTTVIAFLSYLSSSLSALADFGVMCAIGISCAFGSMLLLIPAGQVIRDRRAAKKGKDVCDIKRYMKTRDENGDVLGKVAGVGGRMAARNPWVVLGTMAAVIALFGYSAVNISYSFDMYDFVPEGTEAHDTLTYLNENYSMTTTSTTSVLIYADGWDLDTLMAIELSLRNMDSATESGQIQGLEYGTGPPYTVNAEHMGTALRNICATITASDPVFAGPLFHSQYTVVFDDLTGRMKLPTTPAETLAAETALTTMRSMIDGTPLEILLSSFIGEHDGGSVTRIILNMTAAVDGNDDATIAMKNAIDDACQPLDGIGFSTTGQSIIMSSTMKEMNDSQMRSLLITILFVILVLTAFMYMTHRSLLLGIMATIPTLISVIMVWGTMALMDMPLNVMTLTIASLAVGLGVTYGIHISHRYARELILNDLAPEEAIRKATRETGKGVFAAALTTVAGFGVMAFSKILPMYQFGVITALAIGFGYIGAVFILPSMLVIWGRYAKPKLMDRRNGPAGTRPDHSGHGMSAASEWDRYRFSEPQEPEPKEEHPEWDRFKMD